MEENDENLWWDVVQDINQKDIGKVYRRYERNERLQMHRIFQMEKVIPSFQYEPLVLTLELETSYEEEERGNTDGVGPLVQKQNKRNQQTLEEERIVPHRQACGMTYALKQTLKLIKFVFEEVSYQEYASITIEIGEQIQTKEHRIQEVQQDQIELTLELQQ